MTNDAKPTARKAAGLGVPTSRRSMLRKLAWSVPTVMALQLHGNAVLANSSAPATTTLPPTTAAPTTPAPTTPAPTTTATPTTTPEPTTTRGGGGPGLSR